MAQVSEVTAGGLDPTWLGGAFEVVEEGADGPLVHGMRLVSYRKVTGREKVVLVGENTSVVVDASVRLAFHVAAAAWGRWTGAVLDGAVPQQGAVGWPGGAGYPSAGLSGPGAGPVAGPGPGTPPPGLPGPPGPGPGGPAAPWMRRPRGT
ncbi:hypothetical protein PUR61_38565 [Streptomyces sp. BE20]|uniref:hypothetical protein n=1 Tax=Streptomyces sp. BE20 TaxID=3002525 RepID=UPI002E787C84|nr:hypothetical protein [Streptomyces sp. BE20]MEE1828040.1 hypothetical protein [Streptomyces sp. BE20]